MSRRALESSNITGSFHSRGEVCAHKTSLTPPLVVEVPVSSQEGEQSYICVMDINFSIGF